jgi:hypothetical protein
MDHYLGVAEKDGLTMDKVSAVQALVMAVPAGRVNAQMREADHRHRSHGKQTGRTGACPHFLFYSVW